MKRVDLLKASLGEEKDVNTLVGKIIKKDSLFLTRHLTRLSESLEDAQVSFEERLSSQTELSKADIELYMRMSNIQQEIDTVKEFKEKFM